MSEERTPAGDGAVRPLPVANLRLFVLAALGLLCGCSLYACFAFGIGHIAGVMLFALAFLLFLPPCSRRRVLLVSAVFFFFLLAGGVGMLFGTRTFESGVAEGEYTVTGTVEFAAVRNGYADLTLSRLIIGGERAGGKMEVSVDGESVRVGDILTFTAQVGRNPLPVNGDSFAASDLANDIRYHAAPSAYERTGRSPDVFLRINGALYDALYGHMERDEAGIAYALLTGNMRVMDDDFAEATRTGGIAHVFAVSGMHIGLLYGVVTRLLRRPLGRWAALPALLLAAAYCAMCAFTVSSVRSLLMCAFAGGMRFFGKKYDELSSLSLAAALTLLVSPVQFFSISFRLSYGGMAGIFLFSEPVGRGLRRIGVPAAFADLLVSGVTAQIFTFPMMMETFGYLSAWGILLNLIVIPALPALFLPLMACGFLSLVLPFAAGVLLALPEGLLSAVLFLFSFADLSFVIAGFSLGAGAGVWLALHLPLSGRVRLKTGVRAALSSALALLFALSLWLENSCFGGCRIDVSRSDRGTCALVRAGGESVLLIDDASLSFCRDFLRRLSPAAPGAVAVLSEDIMRGVNTAAFLGADVVYIAYPAETGFAEKEVVCTRSFTAGEMTFIFEGASRMVLLAEGCAAEVCFDGGEALFADFFVGTGGGRLKYLLKDGIIKTL